MQGIRHSIVLTIGLTVGGCGVLAALAGGAGLLGMHRLSQRFDDYADRNVPLVVAFNEMYAQGLQTGQATRNVLLNPDDRQGEKNYQTALEAFEKAWAASLELSTARPALRAALEKVDVAWKVDDSLKRQVQGLAKQGKREEAVRLLVDKETPKWREVRGMLIDLWTTERKEMDVTRAEVKNVAGRAFLWAVILAVLAGVGGLGVLIVLSRSVVRPIRATTAMLDNIAHGDGDLSKRLVTSGQGEIAELGRLFNTFVEKIEVIVKEIAVNAGNLSTAATGLAEVSAQTADGVRGVAERATTVAAAAEEASVNTTSVASTTEETAVKLSAVATATEQMSATVDEIAGNTAKAKSIAERATAHAQTISELMQRLGQAATEIGQVTETITGISAQTKLLALNATIEAARAGAAGKGFAVVANEIKELAQKTVGATEDIKQKVGNVQTATQGAMADIEQIIGVIGDVSGVVAGIATAVEEQSSVTKDVAGNIARATEGIHDVTERVVQTATVSQSIAAEIAGVNGAVGGIRQAGERIQSSASELSALAANLTQLVSHFHVSVG